MTSIRCPAVDGQSRKPGWAIENGDRLMPTRIPGNGADSTKSPENTTGTDTPVGRFDPIKLETA